MADVTVLTKKLVLSFKNQLGNSVSLSLAAPAGTGYTRNFLEEDDRLKDAVEGIIAAGCFGKVIASTDPEEKAKALVSEFEKAAIVTTSTTNYSFEEEI